MRSTRFRFRLGTLLVCVTLLCFWLGYQMRWVHQRRDTLAWIESHQPEDFDFFDDRLVLDGVAVSTASWVEFERGSAPLGVTLLGEPSVRNFIALDRTKLHEPEDVVLDRLRGLFPEAEGVYFVTPKFKPSTAL